MKRKKKNKQIKKGILIMELSYVFDGEEFLNERELDDYIVEEYAPEYFDEYLDEVYGDVRVGGRDYPASEVLHNTDPIRYRCEMLDWAGKIYDEIIESA